MKFEWNNDKNQSNMKKHGLDFQDAELIFLGQTITFVDDRQDYGENRCITLGTCNHSPQFALQANCGDEMSSRPSIKLRW